MSCKLGVGHCWEEVMFALDVLAKIYANLRRLVRCPSTSISTGFHSLGAQS